MRSAPSWTRPRTTRAGCSSGIGRRCSRSAYPASASPKSSNSTPGCTCWRTLRCARNRRRPYSSAGWSQRRLPGRTSMMPRRRSRRWRPSSSDHRTVGTRAAYGLDRARLAAVDIGRVRTCGRLRHQVRDDRQRPGGRSAGPPGRAGRGRAAVPGADAGLDRLVVSPFPCWAMLCHRRGVRPASGRPARGGSWLPACRLPCPS